MPEKMTQQAIVDVALRVRDLMGKEEWSLRRVAEMIDVSRSTLSLFMRGKYKGDSKSIAAKLHQLLESCARRTRTPCGKAFVETTIAKEILDLILHADKFSNEQEGKIGVVIGDSGHGKSTCLRQYAEVNKNTVYVELHDAMTSAMVFAAIARRLGLDPTGPRSEIAERLIENLANRHIIIILDEASHLSVAKLNLLRQVISVKARCPLILAGNRKLLNTINQPITKRGCESLDQFNARVIRTLDLDATAGSRNRGLYSAADIRRLYEYGGIKLTGGAVSLLQAIARTPGSARLHTCRNIITACHLSPVVRQAGHINPQYIVSAVEQLDLPGKAQLPVYADSAAEEAEQLEAVKAG